ncbi:uncharacterized protein BT62DRAFT_993374 [Guyanagaster necrorhizus]|uniref:DUF6533 domain-containing protein n=1 Tax=Guyanagaster necrorhizus TaxID=856835 RepID=A0A9P7VVS1_9AGAR|nr:uncharacterized protein BT62DRAFT_993374 [Guyanagaster necrorhizus MCA 3950]KAG7447767.1 hypothetical protein BT62DRAFT_993374 [Guyanagaster necrorhizus MCA 3950]
MLSPMSTTYVAQLLFAKFAPPAATVLILWDHCLTLDEEVATMWGSLNGQILTKVVYVMNRYFTEVVMLYTTCVLGGLGSTSNTVCTKMTWLFIMSATVLAGILQSFVMMHAYRLWDHRRTIRKTLLVVFVACITGATILAVMTVLIILRSRVQVPLSVDVCPVGVKVPLTVTYIMSIMLFFNLFVIFITLYNALEIPRRSESELFDSLRRDGSRLYLIVSLLWMLLLITSVTLQTHFFFSILMLVWSLKCNIASRMHLRIESFGLSVPVQPGAVIYVRREG